ncbi:MAG: hypothetical protein GY941_00850 [Planctomycetes bacterium]|nr:hypothetical protein [Planctomycetota bacterium]
METERGGMCLTILLTIVGARCCVPYMVNICMWHQEFQDSMRWIMLRQGTKHRASTIEDGVPQIDLELYRRHKC